jgi:hypothetical protein
MTLRNVLSHYLDSKHRDDEDMEGLTEWLYCEMEGLEEMVADALQ